MNFLLCRNELSASRSELKPVGFHYRIRLRRIDLKFPPAAAGRPVSHWSKDRHCFLRNSSPPTVVVYNIAIISPINTDINVFCNAVPTRFYKGNVGGGEQNCGALQGMSPTTRINHRNF